MQRRTSCGRELEMETANSTANAASKTTETFEEEHIKRPASIRQSALISTEEDQTTQNNDDTKYLTGWRLHCLSAA
jgi:hypothetical protein